MTPVVQAVQEELDSLLQDLAEERDCHNETAALLDEAVALLRRAIQVPQMAAVVTDAAAFFAKVEAETLC